jgi:hypothetical protein
MAAAQVSGQLPAGQPAKFDLPRVFARHYSAKDIGDPGVILLRRGLADLASLS